MLKKYAVIGNPIAQSKSPEIHLQFAQQFGHQIEYTRILAESENFNAKVKDFIAAAGLGMNVTAPFKLMAAELANSLSERAKIAQSVNTLIFKNNKIFGDNTDGLGLVNDIQANLNFAIKQKQVLIIGAGGATRGIVLPIVEALPASLTIVNRTAAKASELLEHLKTVTANDYQQIKAGGFDMAGGECFDLVINATSAGLNNTSLPDIDYKFSENSLAYDLVYSKKPTLFMQHAGQNHAKNTCDGLGMLVGQAAYSYKLWHGVMPNTKIVLDQLRSKL